MVARESRNFQVIHFINALPFKVLTDYRGLGLTAFLQAISYMIANFDQNDNIFLSRIIERQLQDRVLAKDNNTGDSHHNSIDPVTSQEKDGLKPKKIISVQPTPPSTFEQHQELVTESFRKSGAEQWLQSKGLEFVADTGMDIGGDWTLPIHDFLNWDKTKIVRFGHKAKENLYALLIRNEDGSAYQAIVNRPHKDKPYQYLAPTGAGNRAFLPHVPKAARRAIAERYRITDPDFLDTDNSFWEFIAAHPEIPIVITEGVKKSLSLLYQGYVGISVYGYRCLHSPDLDRFLPGRDVTIAMDSDTGAGKWIEINSGVLRDAKKLAEKAKKVLIATWDSGTGKGIDDLWIKGGSAAVDGAINNALSLTAFTALIKRFRNVNVTQLSQAGEQKRNEKWLNKVVKYTPTHQLDTQFIKVDDILKAINENTWILPIKSGLGTGKTTALISLLDYLESTGKVRGVNVTTYRNTLGLQTAKKINAHHLHEHSAWGLIRDPDSRIINCLESLIHFPDEYFDGKALVLDELTSIIKHLILSSTCSKNRPAILEKFTQAIKRAAIVICLDGNLSDFFLNYLETLRGENVGTISKIANTVKAQTIPLEIIPAFGQSSLVATIKEVMPLYKRLGKSITIATDSQKFAEKLDVMFRALGYQTKRIDSKTTTKKEIKKYIEDPNCDFDILIYTPSCESGLDINLDGFAHIFAFFCGVVDAATQIQMLRRVRNVDRITVQIVPYCRLDLQRSPILDEMQKEMENALLLDGETQLDVLKTWLDKQKSSPHYAMLCDLMQIRGYEKSATLDCFVELAKAHGYSPVFVEVEKCDKTKGELKDIGKQIKVQEATAIFNARELTTAQALGIKASFTASLEDRYALEKWEIKDTLPEIENKTDWNIDTIIDIRDMWRDIPKLRLLWHCQNLEKSKVLSTARWQNWISQDRFIGDTLSVVYAKAKMINALGILNLQGDFSAESPEIQVIAKIGINKRQGLRSVLGITKGMSEPVQWVSRLLKLVAINIKKSSNKGSCRTYQKVHFSPFVKTVFDCISKRLETQYQQVLEPPHLNENMVLEIESGAKDFNPEKEVKPALNLETAAAIVTPAKPLAKAPENYKQVATVTLSTEPREEPREWILGSLTMSTPIVTFVKAFVKATQAELEAILPKLTGDRYNQTKWRIEDLAPAKIA